MWSSKFSIYLTKLQCRLMHKSSGLKGESLKPKIAIKDAFKSLVQVQRSIIRKEMLLRGG